MPDIVATYRVQLHKDFTFDDLIDIVPYLHQMGISHIYCSPVFESVSGSMHGYDVLDPLKLSGERGGMEGLLRLDRALSSLAPPMKMILDIVPNHMSTDPANPYWYDVLEKGVGSPYWHFFDLRVRAGHKIRLPYLDRELIKIIRSGDAGIEDRNGKRQFRLYDKYYPLKEASLAGIPDVRSLAPEEAATIVRRQNYELVHWFKGLENLSYRRFFDVVSLIGVRMEDERVFAHMHQTLFEIKKACSSIDGVRIDHIDGLADPGEYLRNLARVFSNIWVEKILAHAERIPQQWPVLGTTGYEFMDRINQLFIDRQGFERLKAFWHGEIENSWENFDSCVTLSKEKVLADMFLPEFQRVTGLLADDERTWYFWKALTLMLPVYRTYVSNGSVSAEDVGWVERALRRAGLFPKWEKRVAMRLLQPRTAEQVRGMQEWQQLTGPLMAKGLEDTAHYRYTPLAAFNDVGCTPGMAEPGVEPFIDWLSKRCRDYRWTLNATSTHDTKRSEDSRHRLYALSYFPEQWISFVGAAQKINHDIRPAAFPERVEYFFYQALAATWPMKAEPDGSFRDRLSAYMNKACREMKMETSWLRPNEEFERQVEGFVHQCLSRPDFRAHMRQFMNLIGPAGAIMSLSVLTLKILSGGVPDIYQGTDVWSFFLVDPDNRQPVDYDVRKKILTSVTFAERGNRDALLKDLCENWQEGEIKLWLTKALLAIRKEMMHSGANNFFLLHVSGARSKEVLSLCIADDSGEEGWIITVPIRLREAGSITRLGFPQGYWSESFIELPKAHELTDCLGNRKIPVAAEIGVQDLLGSFPVSVVRYS